MAKTNTGCEDPASWWYCGDCIPFSLEFGEYWQALKEVITKASGIEAWNENNGQEPASTSTYPQPQAFWARLTFPHQLFRFSGIPQKRHLRQRPSCPVTRRKPVRDFPQMPSPWERKGILFFGWLTSKGTLSPQKKEKKDTTRQLFVPSRREVEGASDQVVVLCFRCPFK